MMAGKLETSSERSEAKPPPLAAELNRKLVAPRMLRRLLVRCQIIAHTTSWGRSCGSLNTLGCN
jgi:hypothetical protein